MSETEKNCGNCQHFKPYGAYEQGSCEHPTVRGLPILIPRALIDRWMYPYEGTDCPCHEPKVNDETNLKRHRR